MTRLGCDMHVLISHLNEHGSVERWRLVSALAHPEINVDIRLSFAGIELILAMSKIGPAALYH